mgnify:FL=1
MTLSDYQRAKNLLKNNQSSRMEEKLSTELYRLFRNYMQLDPSDVFVEFASTEQEVVCTVSVKGKNCKAYPQAVR